MGKPNAQSIAAHLFRGAAKKRRHAAAVDWLRERRAPSRPEAPQQTEGGPEVDVAELEAMLTAEG